MMWLLTVVLAATAAGQAPSAPWLTAEQAEKLAVKLAERRPYLESVEARSAEGRQTMGLFFGEADYRRLRGNPVFGYWYAGSFKWNTDRIAWDGVVSKGASCAPITVRAWNLAFEYAARKRGLTIDPGSPYRMRGACVHAVVTASPSEPVTGVVMEIRLDSPTGHFLWRYSRANPSIEGAVGASIELPLLLAPKVNQEGWPHDGP